MCIRDRLDAEPIVTQTLSKQPIPDLRMAYARVLLGLQRYPEASRQLETVTKEKPEMCIRDRPYTFAAV